MMKTVSFQGTTLTNAQRAKLAFQRRATNMHLVEQVNQALQDQQQSTGNTPRWWAVDRAERGTPFVGDIFVR